MKSAGHITSKIRDFVAALCDSNPSSPKFNANHEVDLEGASFSERYIWEAASELIPDVLIADELRRLPYKEYLRSPHWQSVRRKVLREAGNECAVCGSIQRLDVHHRSYEHRGMEDRHVDDLIVLCRECHSKFHGKGWA